MSLLSDRQCSTRSQRRRSGSKIVSETFWRRDASQSATGAEPSRRTRTARSLGQSPSMSPINLDSTALDSMLSTFELSLKSSTLFGSTVSVTVIARVDETCSAKPVIVPASSSSAARAGCSAASALTTGAELGSEHPVARAQKPVSRFASFAAYGDFATGLLAMAALLAARIRPLFWPLVIAFNVVGAVDILVDYYHGVQVILAPLAGQLAVTYWIPIIYVPLLMITHVVALYLLLRPQPAAARALAGEATAS